MKVSEILNGDLPVFNEEEIADKLRKFDWKYEFSDDLRRVAMGNKQLEILENQIYQLWKNNPDKAVHIWNVNSQQSHEDKTIIPSFILRRAAVEEKQ